MYKYQGFSKLLTEDQCENLIYIQSVKGGKLQTKRCTGQSTAQALGIISQAMLNGKAFITPDKGLDDTPYITVKYQRDLIIKLLEEKLHFEHFIIKDDVLFYDIYR